VSNCIFCGKPAGFLHTRHHQCAEAHEIGRRLISDLILHFPSSLVSIENTLGEIKQVAENSFISEAELKQFSIDAWSTAVEQSFDHMMLTIAIERRLIELKDGLSLSTNDLARMRGWERLVEAAEDHIKTLIEEFPLSQASMPPLKARWLRSKRVPNIHLSQMLS
jgi:hypothetical protein